MSKLAVSPDCGFGRKVPLDLNHSKWKSDVLDALGRVPLRSNFFLAECYFSQQTLEKETLLTTLLGDKCEEGELINQLTTKRLWDTPVWVITDDSSGAVRYKFVTRGYPFRFVEEVIAPLCRCPETSLITAFVNSKKKGYAEKRISLDTSEVRSSAYWGMKRVAVLPMQSWAYDITQCNPMLDSQVYKRHVYPHLTNNHLIQYHKTGRIRAAKDYQFFLDGKYSYTDLLESWSTVKDLELEWEELNTHIEVDLCGGAN